ELDGYRRLVAPTRSASNCGASVLLRPQNPTHASARQQPTGRQRRLGAWARCTHGSTAACRGCEKIASRRVTRLTRRQILDALANPSAFGSKGRSRVTSPGSAWGGGDSVATVTRLAFDRG